MRQPTLYDMIQYARGVFSRTRAFKGPHILEINIINHCDLNCIGCFYHSQRKNDRYDPQWKKFIMDKEMVFRLLHEAASIKTSNIVITGNGEPLLHPDLIDILTRIDTLHMGSTLLTNGTGITSAYLEALSQARLHKLALSLWDHDRTRYIQLRPGNGAKYDAVCAWLRYRRDNHIKQPRVEAIFILTPYNYHDIEGMYIFAQEYGIDAVNFKLLRVYDSYTKDYVFTDAQLQEAKVNLAFVYQHYKNGIPSNAGPLSSFLSMVRCDGYMYNDMRFLELPCYIGWLYMVVLDDGSVAPCCGCRKTILGNVHQQSLEDIWQGSKYQQFRAMALSDRTDMKDVMYNCPSCPHHQMMMKSQGGMKHFVCRPAR